MIVEFWLDSVKNEEQEIENMSIEIAISIILEHMTSKNNFKWFNIEFCILGVFFRVNPLNENWLETLAEIEKLVLDN